MTAAPVYALGVDVSTTATALVVLGPDGYEDHVLVAHRTGEQGPRRLMLVRQAVRGTLFGAKWNVQVAAVEAPLNRFRSWPLESCAAVVGEAVQHAYPAAIVLDPTPSEWQSSVIGSGKRDVLKARAIKHAQANGLDTEDDNLADALCIAEYGRDLYLSDVVGIAA